MLQVRIPAAPLSFATPGKLFKCASVIKQYNLVPANGIEWAVMPCGWEVNRRSVVALATRHRQ